MAIHTARTGETIERRCRRLATQRGNEGWWPMYSMACLRTFICTGVLLYWLTPAVFGADDEIKTVQFLHGLCKAEQSSNDFVFCLAYISGIGDLMYSVNKAKKIEPNCSKPSNPLFSFFALCAAPSHGAMVQAFMNWAEKNPQEWGTNKTLGVIMALHETWPCE